MRESFVRGVRLGIPYAVVAFVLSMSFGVVARQAGFTALQAVAASALVFAGSAQFAALAVAASGGTLAAAIAAATLMNGRFLAMGIALAPSLPGGPLKRGLQGQTVVDASWALANNGDGTFDRWLLFGTTAPQYVTWVLGTVAGAYGGDLLGDPDRLGLDAVFPTFFLALVLAELKDPRSRVVALIGALIALCPGAAHATGCADPGRRGGRAARRTGATLMTLDVWLLIAGCVVGTVLIKGVGPVMLGGRDLPPVASRVIASMAPALLAALVVTSVFADGQRYHLGAETVGVLAGGVLLWRGRSVVLAVLVAVLVTAGVRALL